MKASAGEVYTVYNQYLKRYTACQVAYIAPPDTMSKKTLGGSPLLGLGRRRSFNHKGTAPYPTTLHGLYVLAPWGSPVESARESSAPIHTGGYTSAIL